MVDQNRAGDRTVAGWAARRGRELEHAARRAYERQFEIQMEPLCLVHERLNWMRASLDGFSFDGSIVLEIKCPLNLRDRNAAAQGRIPPHYYGQLQHQLEVSGAEEAHYWSFDGRAGCLVKIRPDRDYMQRLVDAEGEFWRRVEENRWPELEDCNRDLTANPQWRSLAVQYRKVRTQFEKLSLEERQTSSAARQARNLAAHLRVRSGGAEDLQERSGRLRTGSRTARGRSGKVSQGSGSSHER